MVELHFRLTEENSDMLEQVVTWIQSVGSVYLAVKEVSSLGKLHIHCIINVNNKSTFIQQFHKYFKNRWHGNRAYSCETLKKDLYNNYVYLCKGTRHTLPDVLHKINDITTDDIKTYHSKYWEDKPEDKDIIVAQKTKKNLTLTWSQELTLDIKKLYPARKWEYCATDIDTLIDLVLKHLGKSSKKLNSFIVRDLVFGQLNALNPDCYGLKQNIRTQAFADLFGGGCP